MKNFQVVIESARKIINEYHVLNSAFKVAFNNCQLVVERPGVSIEEIEAADQIKDELEEQMSIMWKEFDKFPVWIKNANLETP